ncbi:hypothetical protein VTH82DRAFT_1856 [Thermothelomyces myriococcoides]
MRTKKTLPQPLLPPPPPKLPKPLFTVAGAVIKYPNTVVTREFKHQSHHVPRLGAVYTAAAAAAAATTTNPRRYRSTVVAAGGPGSTKNGFCVRGSPSS